jgi:hypothetical protein
MYYLMIAAYKDIAALITSAIARWQIKKYLLI